MDTENFDANDIEKLRSELIDLSEKGEINFQKTFLTNKRRCNEAVMKRIMAEYVEKKQKAT